jgi:EF hand domain-containing protein
MKTTIATLIALTAGLSVLQAQSVTAPAAGSPKASTPRAKASLPLVVATLDANRDGIIDAGEIAKASQALKSLDKNADGRLTREELRRGRPTRPASAAATPRSMKKRPSAGVSETERR